MNEMVEFDFKDYKKKCSLLKAVTKLDVELVRTDGSTLLKLTNQSGPNMLRGAEYYYSNIIEALSKSKMTSYYHFINSYGLEYLASGIWVQDHLSGFIVIGPFLSRVPSMDFISDIIATNKLSISERQLLHDYYKSLLVLGSADSSSIGELLVNICVHKHVDSQLVTSEKIEARMNKKKLRETFLENNDIIELRYEYENKLIYAISKGDKESVKRINEESSSLFNFSDRFPESPIRSYKNLLLVLNTLCRKAAEEGGVHPIYVHSISEKFAILIERATNLPYLKNVNMVMTVEYCDAVVTYSTHHYSPLVKKVINYIHLNLEGSLTLKEIAEKFQVNPSHLSRKFKEDTDTNLIDYINKKRIEEAKYYLKRGNITITDLAFMIGFNDVNYFSRMFKKVTSLTPTQYIQNLLTKEK